jgi:hypothetical protein
MKKRILKKGDVTSKTLFFLFEIMLVIIVMVALLNYVNSIKDNTIFEKKHLTRDIALTANLLSIAPGNIVYIYRGTELNKFDFSFSNNIVQVKETDKDSSPDYFFYSENILLNNKLIPFKAEKSLILSKSGNTITSGDASDYKIFVIDPVIKTQGQKIIIDPQDGATDSITDDIFKISDDVKSINPNLFAITRAGKNVPGTVSDIKTAIKEFDVVVSIIIGDYIQDKNYIKAYYNIETKQQEEIKKLAGLILNSISDKFNTQTTLDGVSIIPLNINHVSNNPHFDVLKNDKRVLVLEIGNVNSAKGKNMLSQDISKIGSAIGQGINEYLK